MQAYAKAEPAPLVSHRRSAAVTSLENVAPVAAVVHAATDADAATTSASSLAALILDGLDESGLAVLARRLLPHLRQPAVSETAAAHVVYTVASLAAEVDVSQKAIRSAIARGELAAVKRGSRWIISADAVNAWATAPKARCARGRSRGPSVPKSAGPSLRAVLCDGAAR